MSLKDKIALITGGSGGLGKAIALKLSEEGAHIAITYNSNSDMAEETVKEIQNNGVKAVAIKANVTSSEQVENMVKIVEEELGIVDILVNNAGITKDNLLIRMKEEDWDQVLDVNLKGVFLCTKALARPMMKQRYGKIINISSVVGIDGNAGQGNYSASKAGIIGFTKSIAKELAGRGIRVNAVAPGFIETDMTDVLKQEVKDAMLKEIPLGGFGKPKDVANVVAFLAGTNSDYITGEVIKVDGGMAI